MRQALWFGNFAAIAALLALTWPLILSLLVTSVMATIWIYMLAMAVDLALFVLWLILAMRYSQRAARGDFFDVSWLTRVTGMPPPKS